MKDPFAGLAAGYNSSGGTLRQVIRHELVDRGLAEHLSGPPASIVDVGGGAGQQALPLLRKGYEVTILDPSREMLANWRASSRVRESGRKRCSAGRPSTRYCATGCLCIWRTRDT